MALKELQWNEVIKLASPYPYALAVTMDRNGKHNIIGLSWWSIVSWIPAMLMISVGFQRYSCECLEAHDEFTLCLPSKEQSKAAWFCGTNSGRDVDKFAETGFKKIRAKIVDVPIIDGCTAAFECKTSQTVDAGDHRVFIADILTIHGDQDKPGHIYTVSYAEMIGFGTDLVVDMELEK